MLLTTVGYKDINNHPNYRFRVYNGNGWEWILVRTKDDDCLEITLIDGEILILPCNRYIDVDDGVYSRTILVKDLKSRMRIIKIDEPIVPFMFTKPPEYAEDKQILTHLAPFGKQKRHKMDATYVIVELYNIYDNVYSVDKNVIYPTTISMRYKSQHVFYSKTRLEQLVWNMRELMLDISLVEHTRYRRESVDGIVKTISVDTLELTLKPTVLDYIDYHIDGNVESIEPTMVIKKVRPIRAPSLICDCDYILWRIMLKKHELVHLSCP